MSQIYAPTRQGKIAMFKDARARAVRAGDWNMVANLNVELATLGVFETTQAVVEMEATVPAEPRRGRRPLPRCEHDQIATRCVICNEELV